jgi:hypothetical protein
VPLEKLCNTLTSHHGLWRGTFDAALAEAQDLSIVKEKKVVEQGITILQKKVVDHIANLRNAASALRNNGSALSVGIDKAESLAGHGTRFLRDGVKPLQALVSNRLALIQTTEDLMLEMRKLDVMKLLSTTGSRLGTQVLPAAGRTVEALASSRLLRDVGPLTRRGISLIPQGLTQTTPWVRALLAEIESLPLEASDAAKHLVGPLMTFRVALEGALRSGLSSPWLTSLSKVLLEIVNRPPLILIVITDGQGNLLGMPRGYNRGPDTI